MIAGYVFETPARIIRWKDGDTCQVEVDEGRRHTVEREDVRVWRLWCPELDEPGGPEALLYAEWLAPSGTVVLVRAKPLGASGLWGGAQESLSRTLADIRLPNGADFATLMILGGHGSAFPPPVLATPGLPAAG